MNARQKAKKYKMAYELLLKEKPHIVFHEVPCPPIDTLSVDMILPELSAWIGDDYIKSFIIDSFADELKKCPEKYIDGYTEYLPYDGRPRLHYRIKVVRRQNNDNKIY